VREAATDTLRQRDSLQIAGVLLVENQLGPFDPAGSAGFASATTFPGVTAATGTAAALFAGLPTGVPTLAAIDWTPAGALAAGGLTAFPAQAAARMAGYFGGTLATTPYRGAAAPDGPRWWQGWTAYARN
jgi:hypothetical protein